MRLAAFIRAHTKQIVSEWEAFARLLVSAAQGMSPLVLRNHIHDTLAFISDDIESPQTALEQIEKSHGQKYRLPAHSAAEIHAALRLSGGFNMDQMVSEYRALRASVTKLWKAQLTELTHNDIADLTRFNESIDQQLTEAISHYTKKLDYSKDVFLGILSHDLRNPLGAILMSSQLTLRLGPLNEKQTMLVSQIAESTARATEIVNHLVDLTRTRLGSGLPVVKETMDMGFISQQMVDETRAMHHERIITLETSGTLQGKWDKARIGQVFSNLLSNALQYSFPDSPIAVSVKGSAQDVAISVHNQGVPISDEAIGRIFDSLTRGGWEEKNDEPPSSVNLGLGLYITKEIVVAHGGTIDVASSRKHGTTFTARLPVH